MRLIDADKLISDLLDLWENIRCTHDELTLEDFYTSNAISRAIKVVEKQPTAYEILEIFGKKGLMGK